MRFVLKFAAAVLIPLGFVFGAGFGLAHLMQPKPGECQISTYEQVGNNVYHVCINGF